MILVGVEVQNCFVVFWTCWCSSSWSLEPWRVVPSLQLSPSRFSFLNALVDWVKNVKALLTEKVAFSIYWATALWNVFV